MNGFRNIWMVVCASCFIFAGCSKPASQPQQQSQQDRGDLLVDFSDVGPEDTVRFIKNEQGEIIWTQIESPDGTIRWRDFLGGSGTYSKKYRLFTVWVVERIGFEEYLAVVDFAKYGEPSWLDKYKLRVVFSVDGGEQYEGDPEGVKGLARKEARKRGIDYVQYLDGCEVKASRQSLP